MARVAGRGRVWWRGENSFKRITGRPDYLVELFFAADIVRKRAMAIVASEEAHLPVEGQAMTTQLGQRRWLRLACVAALFAQLVLSASAQDRAIPLPMPTFTTGVSLVPITAVVRDGRGRVVRNLTREDFEVLEKGKPRPIVSFAANDNGAISVAILFDVSGSMRVAGRMDAGKGVVELLLEAMQPGADEVGLFTFEKTIHEEVPFTTDQSQIRLGLGQMSAAMGLTSLYDAIAQTTKTLAERPSKRRAVIVITDGVDTSSTMTPAAVSGLASASDVPVYVIAVVSPLDHPGTDLAVVTDAQMDTSLSNLAYWTGGSLTLVSAPAHASVAARDLIAELRQQYLLAVESAGQAGWYGLEVRTRKRELNVRARSGYFAGGTRRVS
jgi:Ca-activated chloride channel family protein